MFQTTNQTMFGKLAPYIIITPLVGNMELGSSEPLPPIKEMFHQCSPIDASPNRSHIDYMYVYAH